MIDGIKLQTYIYNLDQWCIDTGINVIGFHTHIEGIESHNNYNNSTIYRYMATYRDYKLKFVKIVNKSNVITKLEIIGSLHKSYFKGSNFQRFYFESLQDEIKTMCKDLRLCANDISIHNLEVGVNIPFTEQANIWLKNNLLLYSKRNFTFYDTTFNNLPLGVSCKMNQYEVKLYDKAIQNRLNSHLLRIEKKFTKMEKIKSKYNISTLEDLTNRSKVKILLDELLQMWDNVIIKEPLKQNIIITKKNQRTHQKFQSFDYWNDLISLNNNQKFQNAKKAYTRLVESVTWNQKENISKMIVSEWNVLFSRENSFLHKMTIKV